MLIDAIKKHCDSNILDKVFTFGIGDHCDTDLVINSSVAGRGNYSLVKDKDLNRLNEKVVDQLQTALEPALVDCQFSFLNAETPVDLGQLFRFRLVRIFKIMTEENFKNL